MLGSPLRPPQPAAGMSHRHRHLNLLRRSNDAGPAGTMPHGGLLFTVGFKRVIMDKPDLAGRHILVVEDEIILSLDICAQIEACGGVVIGPAATLDDGYALLSAQPQPDGGILNIRIGKNMIYPLASELLAAGIPIIFASSESKASIPDEYARVPLLSKPINMMHMAQKLFPAS